jgi:transmembrane sensor
LELVWGALDDLSAAKSQQPAGGVGVTPPAVQSPKRATILHWWPAWGLAAMLAILVGISVGRRSGPAEMPLRYETVVGAQQKVTLPDGSELQLNTDTALTVRFSAHERRATLERGEAFFHVTKDSARPFIVTAGRSETRVVGTKFVVHLRENETDLLVSEGLVKFGAIDDERRSANVGANHHAVLAGGNALRIEALDEAALARRLAWQSGRLEFKDVPLREVVAEFNRYHGQQIVLRDAATEAVRVGGVFEIENFDGFLWTLANSFDVAEVRRQADKIVLGLRP